MNKKIKQFQKYFFTYVKNNERVFLKKEKDMFHFDNDEPAVFFQFAGEKVFVKWFGENRYFVGYLGKINDREEFETLKQCFCWLRKHLDTESKYDYANRITEPLYERIESQRETIIKLRLELEKSQQKTTIKKVIHNKGTTVVWFNDDEKVVVRKAKGEKDSIYSAVAYAIAKRIYDTNSHFQSKVDKVVVKDE